MSQKKKITCLSAGLKVFWYEVVLPGNIGECNEKKALTHTVHLKHGADTWRFRWKFSINIGVDFLAWPRTCSEEVNGSSYYINEVIMSFLLQMHWRRGVVGRKYIFAHTLKMSSLHFSKWPWNFQPIPNTEVSCWRITMLAPFESTDLHKTIKHRVSNLELEW